MFKLKMSSGICSGLYGIYGLYGIDKSCINVNFPFVFILYSYKYVIQLRRKLTENWLKVPSNGLNHKTK